MIPTRSSVRRGYSLTVVLVFLMLLLCLWAGIYRTSASLLRVETARVKLDDLDNGMLGALAQALMYLENNPNMSQTQSTIGITVPVNPNEPEGTNTNFTVKFTPNPPNGCTITVAPST